jgi:hypothetical protein
MQCWPNITLQIVVNVADDMSSDASDAAIDVHNNDVSIACEHLRKLIRPEHLTKKIEAYFEMMSPEENKSGTNNNHRIARL